MFIEEEKDDLKDEEETSVDESENNDDETTSDDQAVEDQDTNDDVEVDDEKEEDDEEEVEDPYEKKLGNLEKDNKRKGTALAEKNKKIKDLKKELENSGMGDDEIEEKVTTILKDQLSSITDKENQLDEALKIAEENNINTLLKEESTNSGEAKIIRFFLKNKVNKELSLPEQIKQASILAKDAMTNDSQFQKEVEKANKMASTSGKLRDSAALPAEINEIANQLFDTKEGKAKFKKLLINK